MSGVLPLRSIASDSGLGECPRVKYSARQLARTVIIGFTLLNGTACSDEESLRVLPEPADSSAGLVGEAEAVHVGAQRCAGCHPAETEKWRGSHHDRAMQEASAETVLGRFDGRTLRDVEQTWQFHREGEDFVVDVSEAGRPTERLRVEATFGVHPLQQYLVSREGGRLQALPAAWDSRPEAEGGERWFSLHPGESVPPGDPLHWDQPAYTWNSQCASCHSTGVDRGYDPTTDRYDTRSLEENVACESCHGPAGNHVARMEGRVEADGDSTPGGVGFRVTFEAWDPQRWERQKGERIASRRLARVVDPQLDVCSPCHSRRSSLVATPAVGAPFLDGYSPQRIEPGLYFEDGQIREEVYVWGSFVQSRMYQAGVRCADCHDPHSLTLRKQGNTLCSSCHDPESFDAPEHRGHAKALGGIGCVDCHMPERIYMEVDGRRDHSFPIPRPARSDALGAPSACDACHSGRTTAWAEAALTTWRGGQSPVARWPDLLVADGAPRTDRDRWLEIARDPSHPAIVRGSAWARYAEEGPDGVSLEELRGHLEGADELEQLGLVALGGRLPPAVRASLLRPLLDADRRAVRGAAAEALADVPSNVWRPGDVAALTQGLGEYRAAQMANAERPEAQVNLGILSLRQGDSSSARESYERAIALAPYFVPARVNLADLERAEGNEPEAIAQLQAALALEPAAVWVRYALGLAHYRNGELPLAIDALGRASREAPDAPRLVLGWALALDASHRRSRAIEVLSQAVDRGTADGEVWQALVTFLRDEGQREAARDRVRSWLAASPNDPRALALSKDLGREDSTAK